MKTIIMLLCVIGLSSCQLCKHKPDTVEVLSYEEMVKRQKPDTVLSWVDDGVQFVNRK
jgi:hypothetical protein